MDADRIKKFELKLRKMRARLTGEINQMGDEIKEEMPKNYEDALNVKEEIEMVELEDGVKEKLIAEVEDALDRIAQGGYGKCMGCGSFIPYARLEAVPYTKLCIGCQERSETTPRKDRT